MHLTLSLHAMDQASVRLLGLWRDERLDEEGLATWLRRRALEALSGRLVGDSRTVRGVKFVFAADRDPEDVTLVTVVNVAADASSPGTNKYHRKKRKGRGAVRRRSRRDRREERA